MATAVGACFREDRRGFPKSPRHFGNRDFWNRLAFRCVRGICLGGKRRPLARTLPSTVAPRDAGKSRNPNLPPCKWQCTNGCKSCMGTQSGRVIAILKFFYDAWFAELYRLNELPFKPRERVLLLETDNRFVNAEVVQLVGLDCARTQSKLECDCATMRQRVERRGRARRSRSRRCAGARARTSPSARS